MRAFLSLTILFLATTSVADERTEFFESKIRPVLIQHCYSCHSAVGEQVEGGLRLDSRDAMLRGGDSGAAVAPNDIDASLLISALKYDSFEMPPDQKLSDAVVADFERWIEQGAIDPRIEPAVPIEDVSSEIDYQEGRAFWAFQRPRRQPLPKHRFAGWALSRIDHFVAAQFDQRELTPTSRADSTSLLRRLSFDLTGLPPSDLQFGEPFKLDSGGGLAHVVDDLLASPAFGEHFARMWLDIMRYADDQAHIVGDNRSLCYPNSYRYRDWVIGAFNGDMPYDRFIELQLAADITTPDDRNDDVALGFIGLGPKYYRRNSREVMADEWEDRVDIVSRGLLGLTVACARCHDHKYDPVATADYYALAGVFASIEMFNRPVDDEREKNDKGEAKDPVDAIHIVRDKEEPQDLSIMIRGDVNRRGPVVPRGFLTVFSEQQRASFVNRSGRLELAREIASRDNPLTARVIVNRIWARLIGKPLVATPSNFGALGERPTHPALLDDLAVRFMESGWSLKWLVREIVTSATYQQASLIGRAADSDPDNRWLARMNRKRLTIEQWRDAVLSATGTLQSEIGGPSIDPSDPGSLRRTVYSEASRLNVNKMLALFDYPDPNSHSPQRARTTTPSQKLFLLNSPFSVAAASAMADRLQKTGLSEERSIEQGYRLILSRNPTAPELSLATKFLGNGSRELKDLLHALFVTNEMFFVD